MIYKFEYKNKYELDNIIKNNNDKVVIRFEQLFDGNFVILKDDFDIQLQVNNQGGKISILEKEINKITEGLQAVLRGDMQELAYILYPKDFKDIMF